MKILILIILFLNLTSVSSQNKLEVVTVDCSQENGFTMFLLDEAEPKILSGQSFLENSGHWSGQKKEILIGSDTLTIEYSNIFGQRIDTTFTITNEQDRIKLCINNFKDYSVDELIERALDSNSTWILESSWGHQTFESDKLILKPKGNYLHYQYFLNGKRKQKGRILVDDKMIENIHLFEKKLRLMNRPDGNCNFEHNYRLIIDDQSLEIEDFSCSGFSNQELLEALGIEE